MRRSSPRRAGSTSSTCRTRTASCRCPCWAKLCSAGPSPARRNWTTATRAARHRRTSPTASTCSTWGPRARQRAGHRVQGAGHRRHAAPASQVGQSFGQPTFDIEGISLSCIGSEWEGVMMAMRFFPVVTQLPDDPSSWTTGASVGTATGATGRQPGHVHPRQVRPRRSTSPTLVLSSPARRRHGPPASTSFLGDASHAHWDASTWVVGDAVVTRAAGRP